MKEIKIIQEDGETKILVDGEYLRDCVSYALTQHADDKHAVLTLKMFADASISVETDQLVHLNLVTKR